jgi:hypothetical protein
MGALRCAYSITAAASLVSRTTSTSWIGCCAVHAPGTADCLYDLALAKHSGAFCQNLKLSANYLFNDISDYQA